MRVQITGSFITFVLLSGVIVADSQSERMAQANHLQEIGNYSESLKLYRGIANEVEAQPGSEQRLAEVTNNIAVSLYRLGQYG